MKRFIIGGLSLLVVSAVIAPAVKAQRQTAASPISSEQIVHSLSVVNLVEFGYRGEFSDRGIPGYTRFVTAVNTGDVTAEDLVEAAIADGRLPESAMDDSVFLYRVKRNMLRVTDHDN